MITKLTDISSKTPIAMLPDVINNNNTMVKLELYPNDVVNGTKTLPVNLKSLCNANGEIQRSINIDSENTFKINHGEVTNDLNVYGKVVTNGVITKELTINEKLTINSQTLLDFIEKNKSTFSDIITDDMINAKITEALNTRDELGKTILDYKINECINQNEDSLRRIAEAAVETCFENYKPTIIQYIQEALAGATQSDVNDMFNTMTPNSTVQQQ